MAAFASPARVGILGGMGPAATADFYRKLVEATPARCDQDHIPVLMEADPTIPDRTECFLRSGPSPLPLLLSGALALQARGAQLIAMPCNTAHLWYEGIASELTIPLVHIVDAVIDDLSEQLGIRSSGQIRVGLLATGATIAGELYQRRAAQFQGTRSWCWVLPTAAAQAELQSGIAAVKASHLERASVLMESALAMVQQQGVEAVVYACTEVPLALGSHPRTGLISSDSTVALARLTVRLARSCSPTAPIDR